ncbi:MAG: VRR-NUC protein [Siphoviridae sp. ctCJE6]|nr:MAG: VRR-NUC protein [Siphoviridae sp. ctCJE6]
MKESALTREILRKIRLELGGDVWFYKSSDRFNKGIPDIIMCLRGRFVAIEIKRPCEKPTRIQEINILQINQSGGVAFVATSVDQVMSVLRSMDDFGWRRIRS